MSQEQINILLDNVKCIRKDIETLRNEMNTEHEQLVERVSKLEYSARVTRWIFAFGGGMLTIIAREMLPLLF